MKMMMLLQAAGAPAPAAGGSSWSMWIMLILIFVVMWLFMIRPQRKQQKELQNFRDGLKKGDKVVTVVCNDAATTEIYPDNKTVSAFPG